MQAPAPVGRASGREGREGCRTRGPADALAEGS